MAHSRHPPRVRERWKALGLRAFFRITREWGLSESEQADLLGLSGPEGLRRWQQQRPDRLGMESLERISHVLGIYRALGTLFADPIQAAGWVRRPNTAPLFDGRPALDVMREGTASLLAVRTYLGAMAE